MHYVLERCWGIIWCSVLKPVENHCFSRCLVLLIQQQNFNLNHTMRAVRSQGVKNMSLILVTSLTSSQNWDALVAVSWNRWCASTLPLHRDVKEKKTFNLLKSGFLSDIITIFLHQQNPLQTLLWIPAIWHYCLTLLSLRSQ